MPTTNQGDYGMLHVTLMSKDGRKLLIDENFSVDMDLMEDGTLIVVSDKSFWLSSFYYVKYGLSIIVSKIRSRILSNENKKNCGFQKSSLF